MRAHRDRSKPRDHAPKGERDCIVQVRVTEQELAQLRTRAAEAGITVPQWLRECGLGWVRKELRTPSAEAGTTVPQAMWLKLVEAYSDATTALDRISRWDLADDPGSDGPALLGVVAVARSCLRRVRGTPTGRP